jgi:hypothetical protein
MQARLHKAAQTLNGFVGDIHATDINRWLVGMRHLSGRTKNNYRAALATLLSFARQEGHLPRGIPTVGSPMPTLGKMHLYLNSAREHWSQPEENPPVGIILCAGKGGALVRYATDNLPNKVLVREYLTALPDEKRLATELDIIREKTRATAIKRNDFFRRKQRN